MEHFHQDVDLPEEVLKKVKLYWIQPDVFEFKSVIKEISNNKVRLEKNYFYPEGGGQLSDFGVLTGDSGEASVLCAEEIDDEIWLHLNNMIFEEKSEITAIINKDRRFNLSQHHSGQHLVSAVFHKEFDNETTRAEINTEYSVVELKNSPSLDELLFVQNKISRLILENLSIENRFYNTYESIDVPLRGKPENQNLYRIVGIGKYDFNPCGGTHINSTSELGSIYFSKIESKKLKFSTGISAHIASNQVIVNAIKSARTLKIQVNDLPQRVQELAELNKLLEKQNKKLLQEKFETLLQTTQFEKISNYEIKIINIDGIDQSIVNQVMPILKSQQGILIQFETEHFSFFAGSENLVLKLKKHLLSLEIKSEGQGKRIMGKTKEIFDLELFYSFLS